MKSRLKGWCIAAAAFPIVVLANTPGSTSTDPSSTKTAVALTNPAASPGSQTGAEVRPATNSPAPTAVVRTPDNNTDSTAAPSGSDETATMEKQKRLWKDRAEIARYRAEVATEDARARQAYDGATSGTTPTPSAGTAAPAQAAAIPVAPHEDFTVQFSGAVDGHWEADMVVDGQLYSSVQVGNVVGGGWKVTAITDSTVEFRKGPGTGGQTKVVRF